MEGPLFALRDTVAVSELLSPASSVLKWHFPQENATVYDAGKGTVTRILL
jgi:hypothetical protein